MANPRSPLEWNRADVDLTLLDGMEDVSELWNAIGALDQRILALGLPAPFGRAALMKLASMAKTTPADHHGQRDG